MGKTGLSRDVFIALAAVGWADGKLDKDEADAIVRTAVEEGLELEQITEIEQATRAPVALEYIEHANLSREDRLFVYGVALWLSRVDGTMSAPEIASLQKLGELLKLPDAPRRAVDSITQELALAAERPQRFDLSKLRETIAANLAAAEARKAARA